MGGAHIDITGSSASLVSAVNQSRQAMGQLERTAKQSGVSIEDMFSKAKQFAATAGISIGVQQIGHQILAVRGEFQQLEVAFGTMLGSGEMAKDLMLQLTQTAARTPFDLKGVANAAKQLLAYGTEASEVNDILVKLGDVAAGLSIPLNDLVYVYGTTMVQGRMFTQDLRQLQGRGVPIAEALAQQFGVATSEVQNLVTEGKVTAEEFKKAMLSMSDSGGKFAGLMGEQSKTISGQISNIEDSIDMMFNDIGKQSEGAINLALSGVSKLVENYKSVGTAILAIAGTYGTYRAALIAVAAIEKAHNNMIRAAILEKKLAAAANITLSNSDAMAAARKTFFTKTIKLNTMAWLKNTAAMLSNPAVAITAGIVALGAAIWGVTRALDTQARSQEKVNKLNQKNKEYIEDVKSQSDQAISTLQSETATTYEKAKAYELLKKIMPSLTDEYTQQEIATLDLTEAQKAQAKALEDLSFDNQKKQMSDAEERIKSYKKQIDDMSKMPNASGAYIVTLSNQLSIEEKALKTMKANYLKMVADRRKAEEEAAFNALSNEEKINALQNKKIEYQAKLNELVKQKEDGMWSLEIGLIPVYEKKITDVDAQITNIQKNANKLTQDQIDLREKEEETLRKVKQEEESILAKSYTERKQRYIQLKQELADIQAEEKKYIKENGQSKTAEKIFSTKRRNAQLKYELDIENLDRQFDQWLKEKNEEAKTLRIDIETSMIESAIDNSVDYASKRFATLQLRDLELENIVSENENSMNEALLKQLGGNVELLEKFKTGDTSLFTDKDIENLNTIVNEYSELLEIEKQAATIRHGQEDFSLELNAMENYVADTIALEQERIDQINRIQESEMSAEEKKLAEQQVNANAQDRQKRINKEYGFGEGGLGDDELGGKVADFGVRIADQSFNQINALWLSFKRELEKDIESTKKEISSKESDVAQKEQLLSDAQASGDTDSIVNAENELLLAKQALAEVNNTLIMQEKALETATTQYTKAHKDSIDKSIQSANKEQKELKDTTKKYNVLAQNLNAVRDAADSIADTFGGALSKKGKKALNAISQIADFGINAVNSISSIVTSVSKGMEATTASAAAGISTVEKASVILTIISLAVQLIMKIVEIAKQFTAEAKLQDSIDDHLAKVEELERKQQLIEAQYATSQGSEYYKGLAKSAERYNAIIEENNKALREAEQLYQLNVSKYGADSDKAQEAKEQYDELKQQDQEYRNEEIEAFRELMEELSGTSLDSFAENLADALIEGFAMGRDGIDEVWEDTMDDILRTMMRNELALALKDQFDTTFENFANNTSDGDLSQADMDEFMNNLEQGKAAAEQIANAYYEAMSTAGLLDDEDVEGSKGFGQMTQDQADTLTARFTALQIEGANISAATGAVANAMMLMSEDIKNVVGSIQGLLYNSNIALQMAQDRLDQLQIIADNTAMLSETNNRLKAIEQNTGRL